MRLGSLCSGYGGLDGAVAEVLGATVAWHAEVDQAASTVLDAHWPGVPNHGDIRAADWSTVEPVDVLAAGWPCPPFSVAGKRRGRQDERHLWPTGVQPAIAALRPVVFVGENVPGILTIEQGSVFGEVLADLTDLGYATSWTVVGACRVGACHHRHRLFLAAVRVELVADAVWPAGQPSSRRTSSGWAPWADTLFGEPGPPVWPASGVAVDGCVWPLPVDTCGANGPVLPTPTAVAYGNNQSASEGAAVRPSLDGVVRMLPTPTARIADRRGTPSAETAAQRIFEEGRRHLEDAIALLPTPTARDGISGPGHAETAEGSPDLRTVVSMLPTPRARDVKGAETVEARQERIERGTAHEGYDLPTAVSMLPTPTARDATRGAGWGEQSGRPLSEVVPLLPTPVAGDAERASESYMRGNPTLIGTLLPTPLATDADGGPGRCNNRGEPKLSGAVTSMLPTPCAADTLKDGPGARGSKGEPQLPGAVHLMPTPRASDAEKGGPNQRGSAGDLALAGAVQPGRFGVYETAVRRQEAAFGLPAPEPTEPGRRGRPRLSAAFPEWMLALPRGWLTDHVKRNDAVRLAGNGVLGPQAVHALLTLPTVRAYLDSLVLTGGTR